MYQIEGRHVLLGVSGGIAVYKACELIRTLQKAGCEVRVMMTDAAVEFVGITTMHALSLHPVATSMFQDSESVSPHIDLAKWADCIAIVPATGNTLAKLANGFADNIVTTTVLAATSPVVVAPTMNVHMYTNPITQKNIETLEERGVSIVRAGSGYLACGDVGEGRMADVDEIAHAIYLELTRSQKSALYGKHVVVTAGPTYEPVDTVRFLGNYSSGKMGYAIARELVYRHANVTLISGPTQLDPPMRAKVINVQTAAEMYEKATEAFASADAAVCAAAVADYRPQNAASKKLKKDETQLDEILLTENPDILKALCDQKGSRPVIGFAAEDSNVIENAQRKLKKKGCDLIVANDVSQNGATFGSDNNQVSFITANNVEELDLMSKTEVAANVVNRLEELL